MSHTPTPWVSDRGTITEPGGNRGYVQEIAECHIYDPVRNTLSGSERDDNAEFIVRACNAHDGLLKALKNMLSKFNKNKSNYGFVKRADIEQAEAAIALTEERTGLKSRKSKEKDVEIKWCSTCGESSETDTCPACVTIFGTYDPTKYKVVDRVQDEMRLEEINPNERDCDQCVAVMINGVFCHELGCPNQAKEREEEKNWRLAMNTQMSLGFAVKFYKGSGEETIKDLDSFFLLILRGYGSVILKTNPSGISVFYRENYKSTEHLGNLKPTYPTTKNIELLQHYYSNQTVGDES